MKLDAYHLPGLAPDDVEEWTEREYDDVVFLLPVLRSGAIARLARRLRASRDAALADRPVRDIIDAIDAAAARLIDPGGPHRGRLEHALPQSTGYSVEMVRLVLDRMAEDWRRPALERLLDAELGSAEAVDTFAAGRRPGTLSRAFGPELVLHVFAGNVPGIGVTSLVRALLVRSASLAKTASREPLLAAEFARALAATDAGLGACIAVTHWPGGTEHDREAAAEADALVVYGGAEAVRAFRRHAPPAARVIEHGPRLSVGVIGRDALRPEVADRTAAAAARAVAVFDQQGCVSPHAFFVETGAPVTPRSFARRLAAELESLETRLPRGRLDAAEAAVIQAVRATAEFRAIAGEDVELLAGSGTTWTVIHAGSGEFEPACLNRTVRILPIADAADVAERLAPYRAVLQTVGVEGLGDRRERVAATLARAGATRVTSLERMPWPPPEWHHDGGGPLLELVRWVDLEDPDTGGSLATDPGRGYP